METAQGSAIALLTEDESPAKEIRILYKRVQAYYLREPPVEAALGMIEQGMRFLEAVRFWYESTLGRGRGRRMSKIWDAGISRR